MLRYTVKHGFNRQVSGADKWFSTENADEVVSLPRADRDHLIALGYIEEHDDRSNAAAPAVPATPAKGK
jgi:hypothetical protein